MVRKNSTKFPLTFILVSLTLCFLLENLEMGEHGRESAFTKGTIWPQIGMQAAASTARSKLAWRETVEGSLSHFWRAIPCGDRRNACGNCGNFPDCAAIYAFTFVVPLRWRGTSGVAEIAENKFYVARSTPVSAYGRRPCISERARRGVSSCNDVLPFGVLKPHEDRTEDCRRLRRAHRHPA